MNDLNTIVAGFALLCALAILRAIHKLYDQGIRHEGLPKMVRELTAKLDAVVARFDAHCREEEGWQEQTRQTALSAASQTQVTLSQVETRLTDRITQMEATLAERRRSSR